MSLIQNLYFMIKPHAIIQFKYIVDDNAKISEQFNKKILMWADAQLY